MAPPGVNGWNRVGIAAGAADAGPTRAGRCEEERRRRIGGLIEAIQYRQARQSDPRSFGRRFHPPACSRRPHDRRTPHRRPLKPMAADVLSQYFDLIQNPARPWAYPFAGGSAPPDPKLPKTVFRKPTENWESACSRKRLHWLEKQAWARPPKPRASGVIKHFASTGGMPKGGSTVAGPSLGGGGGVHTASAPALLLTPTEFFDSLGGGSGMLSPSSSTCATHDDEHLVSSMAQMALHVAPRPKRPRGHSGKPLLTEPSRLRPLLARRLMDAYPHEKPNGLRLPTGGEHASANADAGRPRTGSRSTLLAARPSSASSASLRLKQKQQQEAWLRRRGQLRPSDAAAAAPGGRRPTSRSLSSAPRLLAPEQVTSRALHLAVDAAKGHLLSTEGIAEMLDVAHDILAVAAGNDEDDHGEASAAEGTAALVDGTSLLMEAAPAPTTLSDERGTVQPSPRPPFPHDVASRPSFQATFGTPLSMSAPRLGPAPDLGA